jgi:gag-polyprotein putative aspartyl protease
MAMNEISYTKIGAVSPIPILSVKFRNIDNTKINPVTFAAILDTGSDLTLVPYQMISQLQAVAIDRKQQVPFRGLGRTAQGLAYRLEVSLVEDIFLGAKVIAIPDDIMQGEVIIGRNILNRYNINFNGPQLWFSLCYASE